MILSLLTLCCSFILAFIPTYSFNQNSYYLEKEIVFEDSYNPLATDEFLKFSNDDVNEELKISFFLEEPKKLDNLRLNRPMIKNSILNMQDSLMSYRKNIQKTIYENNLKVMDEISYIFRKCEEKNIEISNSIPLVTVTINLNDLNSNLISHIESALNQPSTSIDEVYIGKNPKVSSMSSLPLTFEKINVSSMIELGPYDGTDINLGIIESTGIIGARGAVLNKNEYNKNYFGKDDYYQRNIITRPGQTSTYYHADHVAMIAAGNNGIARDSNILSCYSSNGANDYISWMLKENMNVANGSFGGTTDFGIYYNESRIFDELIKNYLFTFVAAAGNKTYDKNGNVVNDNYVTWPATGYNVISVGNSYESTNMIGAGSCYKEMDSYYGSKPNLVAPGTTTTNSFNIYNYENNRDPYSGTGTSYAAPQVTGCIALLMEEYPFLIAYPELCLSIVTASASPMSEYYNSNNGEDNHFDIYGSGLHNQIGSGLLNYEKMREAAKQYKSITVPKSTMQNYSGSLDEYIEFRVPNNKRIRASLAWLANGKEQNDLNYENFSDYDLYLTRVEPDGSENTVMRVYGGTNNVEFLDYAVETGGLFRLRVWKCGKNNQNDFLGLSYVTIDDNGGSRSGATEYSIPTLGQVNIETSNYDFGNVYNNTAISENITATSYQTIKTKRLRAAIVENHLVLSAKNKDAGTAYLEYEFPHFINTVEFDFGLWSENESLIKNSFIALQCYHSDRYWYTIKEFKAKEMGQDKNILLHYSFKIPILTTSFRFYIITNQVQNDNNRGRVVIGNIIIS